MSVQAHDVMEGRNIQLKRIYQHLHGSTKVRSRQVRQRVIFGVILTVLVAVLFFAFHAFSVSASRASTHTIVQLNNAGPESIGIRYGHSTSPPKITQQQAIQIATTRLGLPLAHQATHIHALYVLFSDDQYYSTDAKGQKNYFFQNVPAWVVTFQGVNFANSGRGPARFNHEVNVVINAQTGEYMELFTYR